MVCMYNFITARVLDEKKAVEKAIRIAVHEAGWSPTKLLATRHGRKKIQKIGTIYLEDHKIKKIDIRKPTRIEKMFWGA